MPSRFQDQGFLADDMASWADWNSPSASGHVALAKDITHFVHSLIYSIRIPRSDCHGRRGLVGPITALLALRSVGLYQGIFLMVRRGMVHEAAILGRALLELQYKVNGIQSDPACALAYAAEDEHFRLRIINNFLNYPDLVPDGTAESDLMELKVELEESIETAGHPREFKTWEWAKFAGMESSYRVIYAYLSAFTHGGARHLESMMIVDEDDELKALAFEPTVDEKVMQFASESILQVIHVLDREFGLYIGSEIDIFSARLLALMTKEQGGA